MFQFPVSQSHWRQLINVLLIQEELNGEPADNWEDHAIASDAPHPTASSSEFAHGSDSALAHAAASSSKSDIPGPCSRASLDLSGILPSCFPFKASEQQP